MPSAELAARGFTSQSLRVAALCGPTTGGRAAAAACGIVNTLVREVNVRQLRITAVGVAVAAGITVVTLYAQHAWNAIMTGDQEVPSVSTVAAAEFNAVIAEDDSSVSYTLKYNDLEGTVTQAHIHFADLDVNGGISVWLCSNLTSPPTPPGVQACPAPPATITGTFSAVDVVGPAAQGIAPGEFAELLDAIRMGLTYANVHSTKFPGGEVRGQLRAPKNR
jgi:hypothetical protein